MPKTVLWIYSKPLCSEAGGTERITSLIQRGLRGEGYNCMDILVLNREEDRASYHEEEVGDVYQFLKENKLDVVINQWGQLPEFLSYFLDKGGRQWHEEGGKIISCLHFDPKMISYYDELSAIEKKSWREYINLVKAKVFANYYAKRDMRRLGETYRKVYELSDAYVLLSEGFVPYFKEATGIKDSSRLYSINNPLTFETNADSSILDNKKNVMLVVSRMYERQKRITLVLKVWERLANRRSMRDWELKIVGDGPDMERYQRTVDDKKLERISFVGHQSPEPYYAEAKIFLMTSVMEGWGLTITESLQKGVVPIAFDTCAAFHDMITDGENGFVVSEGNISQYVKKVELLATDTTLWQRLAKNALDSANRFSLEKITKQWEKIIEG